MTDTPQVGEPGPEVPDDEMPSGSKEAPEPVDGTGEPEQTDNRSRDEDGEQDVSQDQGPAEGSV